MRSPDPAPGERFDSFARDHLPPPEAQPEFLFERPELQFPARLNCATELLDRWVERGQGGRMCIQGAAQRWTYAELQAQANRIARVLVDELGLVPGNRVLLRGANSPMLAACWFAVVKAGGIAVGSMPLLRARELTQIVVKAQVTHALCDAGLAAELDAARPDCPTLHQVLHFGGELEARAAAQPARFDNVDTAADDTCLIAFTSGTTGVPKGTMHFHRDVMAACACWPPHVLRARPDDVFIGSPPLAFTFGLGGLLLFPLSIGASAALVERASPDALLPAIAQYRASVLFTAPTSYRAMALQLAAHPGQHDLSSLRKCVSAGEALPAATRTLWKQATGIEIIDGIGSTEMLHIFISADEAHARPGATGFVVPGYRAAVLGDDGRELPRGQVGRLAVKGPTGCKYLDDARQANYVQGGWNLTGDAYRIAEDGQFEYQARTDDMIISGGYNIAGPEVESALLLHPAVAECGVVGWPDEARGQIVKAFVVLKPGEAADAAMVKTLQDFVKATVAPYKYPREIEFRASLPRTETGKLQRFRLRAP
ncbi:MAG: 2-aminobenzoate-CoA ligase [Rubrivivax sp. SCN 70-15]|nr:MAG: 2-aminobenzoate-CoA ligase [Rubrivivax sp. SCN 70-15]